MRPFVVVCRPFSSRPRTRPMTAPMQAIAAFPQAAARQLKIVLTDIDDTLTDHGRLPAAAYGALERLADAGLAVVPVTGRPAGWCDMIARFWPVAAVVGENGAFWYAYDHTARRMERHYALDDATRVRNRAQLDAITAAVLAAVAAARIAADQAYREADLAIDFAEDVGPLSAAEIDRIVAAFTAAGAIAKVSSIHVNGWFGDYDKRTTTLGLLSTRFALRHDAALEACTFVGDSPNDAPMFACFPLSVGVANVRDQIARIATPPAFVTSARGGAGFVEFADRLLALRAA